MAVEINNLSLLLKTTNEHTLLKPGDHIAVRVIKRSSPFRYLVSFGGHKFKVNSSVLLNPKDRILLELVKIYPRFEFKFITILENQKLTLEGSKLEHLLGMEKNVFNQQFVASSLGFNLPIKKSDYKELKRFLRINQIAEENIASVLILHHWFQTSFHHSVFSDPFELMKWLLTGKSFNKQKDQIKRDAQETDSEEEKLESNSVLNLMEAFGDNFSISSMLANPGNLKSKIENMVNSWAESRMALDDLLKQAGNDTESISKLQDIICFLSFQVDKFNNGNWILFPVKNGKLKQNNLAFIRRRYLSNESLLDFSFIRDSKSFGLTAVQGEIENNRVRLKLLNNHPGFNEIIDKYNTQLKSNLKKIGLHLTKIEINSGRDIFEAIGKTLTEVEKINVRW